MAGSSCQRWQASIDRSGLTQLSWPICAVPSWQGRSQSLGFLRSASCAKSPRHSKTKWRLQEASRLATGSLQCQATFTSSFAPTSVSFTYSKVSSVRRGFWSSPGPGVSVLWGSPFAMLSAPSPVYPALLPCKFLSSSGHF